MELINFLFLLILIFVIILFIIYDYYIAFYKYNYYKTIANENKNYFVIEDIILNNEYNFYNKTDLSKYKFVIMTAHYNENLFWLKNINVPYIISSKTEKNKNLHININKGNEVSAYLSYIIKYYDNLPEYTLFVHGHNIDWHQYIPLTDIIKKYNQKILQNENIPEYININSVGCNDRNEIFGPYLTYMNNLKNVWNELFLYELGIMPNTFYDKCCAQFIVHRNRIKLRSKEFYKKLLDFSLSDKAYDSKNKKICIFGYTMEYIWHYIFGEKAIMNYNREKQNILNLYIIYD